MSNNFNNFNPTFPQAPIYPTTPSIYQRPQLNQYAFVNGIEGAKSYQVMPNQTMLLMDSDNPICYMKQADNLGKSILRYFKLEEIDESKTRELIETKPKENVIEYALKSDIETTNKKIEELSKLIKKMVKSE